MPFTVRDPALSAVPRPLVRSIPAVLLTPVARATALLVLAWVGCTPALAQNQNESARPGFLLPPPAHDGTLPLYFEADKLEGASDDQIRASGSVQLKQGEMVLRADELIHTQKDNMAKASGHVQISRQGNVFEGPQLRLALDTMEGEFLHPTYWFSRTQAGGKADLIQFQGSNRLTAIHATYTSCTPQNTQDKATFKPAWELVTSKVDMNFVTNEGRAENAVIWFQGVPILAAPVLTFPLNDQRKSGWLPPSFDFDNRSGFDLSVPYYWNIAPNYDATLTPSVAVRRGSGIDTEFRFLLPHDSGQLHYFALPEDRLANRGRDMLDFNDQGAITSSQSPSVTAYNLRWRRVSDDDYWKDFPRNLPSITPRLYDSHVQVEHQLNSRNWGLGSSQTTLYGGLQSWQTLKDLDPTADPTLASITAPYGRQQVGVHSRSTNDNGLVWSLQSEVNHFTNQDPSKITGSRLHAIGSVERVFGSPGGVTLLPRLSLNAASYSLDQPLTDGRREVSRTVPTFSLDASAVFERPLHLFSQDLLQTLEPRFRYVRTPYVDQSDIPLFDSAARDFNQYSIYSDNAYTGVDRITDANQVTLGVTSKLINASSGAEAMRLGVVQKLLLATQRINPDSDQPLTQRLSDMLLLGSTTVIPNWSLDSVVQLSAVKHRTERAVIGTRYSPGLFRTINLAYRYTRDSSEQIDLGWQWPIAGNTPTLNNLLKDSLAASPGAQPSSGGGCGGTWYAVGRLNYSMRDKQLANSLLGVEYDAGCWIARVVSERVSVGRNAASSRIMFQLELVGLSRIGSSPLKSLRDNIPGYQLLRSSNALLAPQGNRPNATDD
ncbi:MAG: LPS-assembly protein LptD [Burkholderiales bacterium]|nr:LPS-assembly protein LptD [Burkholderiales bacterium]